jgi:hypothetical protein
MRITGALTPAVGPFAWGVLEATVLLSIGGVALAQSNLTPAVVEDERLLPYVKPGQLVDIGGRRINLRCTGTGGPTVILISGAASWSPVWYLTQPEVAKRARVCAFGRALDSATRRPSHQSCPTQRTTCTQRSRPPVCRDLMFWWGTLWEALKHVGLQSSGHRRSPGWC